MSFEILPEGSESHRRTARGFAGSVVGRTLEMLPIPILESILTRITCRFPWASEDEVSVWRAQVARASRRAAGHGCLQRSLGVWFLGAIRRRRVRVIAGFDTAPFVAHAWVSLGSGAVLEPEGIESFNVALVAG